MFSIGSYDKKPNYPGFGSRVALERWFSSKHNMGMAFTRETWNKIKNCANVRNISVCTP